MGNYNELVKQGHAKDCVNEAFFVLAKDKYSKNYFEVSLIKAAVDLKLEYSYSFEEETEEYQHSRKARKDQSVIDEEKKAFDERKQAWDEEQKEMIKKEEEEKETEPKEEAAEEDQEKNSMEQAPKESEDAPRKPEPFPEKYDYYHTIEETKTRQKVTCTMNFGDFKDLKGIGMNKLDAKAAISSVLVRKLDAAYGWIPETPQWDVKWSKLLENQVRKENGRPSNWDDEYYGENCTWIAEQEAKKKEAARL